MRQWRRRSLSVVFAVLTATCTGDSTTAPQPAGAPSLQLNPSSLTFTATQGDSVSQTFAVISAGGPIQWSATADSSWLTVSPSSGTTPTTITVVGRTSGLAPAMHGGAVTIVGAGASNSPQRISVSLAVVPRLVVSATSLVFGGDAGQSTIASQSIGVNVGGSTITAWTATKNADWITLAPTSGTGDGTVNVGVNGTGLVAGNYQGSVTIAAAGAAGSPLSVPVVLTLTNPRVTIATTANPAEGGAVTGAGQYNVGDVVTLSATPATGFDFLNWSENGLAVATTATYSFLVAHARTLTATFGSSSVTITTASNPASGGTTSGGGSVTRGSNVTVTATPNSGYSFTNWTENGAVVSTSPTYAFTATASRALVANFTPTISSTFIISASANPAAGGSTSGGGTFVSGATATVTATANPGYTFTNWTESGIVVATTSSYSFTVNGARTLVANFSAVSPATYTISTSSNPAAGGTTTGGGTVTSGSSVTVVATPNTGYTFTNWTQNGVVVSTTANYTFTASANVTLVANFTAQATTRTLTLVSSPANGGTTSGGGVYPDQSTVTLTATPAPGFYFVDWTENGVEISLMPSLTILLTLNRTITANFSTTNPNFVITTTVNIAAGGTVTGAGTYHRGETATVTATPNAGYTFNQWTNVSDGSPASLVPTYPFTVVENRSLQANFRDTTSAYYYIMASSSPAAGGLAQGTGFHTPHVLMDVMAVANNGYQFINWTENGTVVSSSAAYWFIPTNNRELVAHFNPLPPLTVSISTSAVPISGGSTSGGGVYSTGSNVTVTATPNAGYAFSKWTENGPTVSTSPSYTFTANSNHFFEAQFVPTGSMNPSPPTASQESVRATPPAGKARRRQTARDTTSSSSGATQRFAP